MFGERLIRISRICVLLILVWIFSTIFYGVNVNDNRIKRISPINKRHEVTESKILLSTTKRRNFSEDELGRMSVLGKWLISDEGSVPPPIAIDVKKRNPFLILIWRHGPFLERRHIRRFTSKKFSPWKSCSVNNCILSYESRDLAKADAVVFHLHLTRNVSELPRRPRPSQRWIFLTDESPVNTFLFAATQRLSSYNGLFNWSMSYRMDSDVPVPYGRTISRSAISLESSLEVSSRYSLKSLKIKLVAIMASNCGGNNGRWDYVRELKALLPNSFDIYGRCEGGNTSACPGHFAKDCSALDAYKFYLAFENSNCREYLTEKVFWNGYKKWSVPIVMGASMEDCERLLPPRSFLHIDNFARPKDLANYIQYLHLHDEEYLKYHEWRRSYKVFNEHGYFGSASLHYCRICEALHYNSPDNKVYQHMEIFWNKKKDCSL